MASVLLPVRDGGPWIRSCLAGLARQSADDIEIVLVDHGSTDDGVAIAESLHLSNLVVIRVDGGTLGGALNAGLARCRADVIIRQDVDDESLPHRTERQVALLQSDQTLAACGAWSIEVSAHGRERIVRSPTQPQQIRMAAHFWNPLAHSTMAIRRSAVLKAGGFGDEAAEDFSLWLRLLDVGDIAVIPEVLVRRHAHPESVMATAGDRVNESAAALLTASWHTSDIRAVRAASFSVGSFVARRRRLPIRTVGRLYAAMWALRSSLGWRATRRALPVSAYLRPLAWTVISPRSW